MSSILRDGVRRSTLIAFATASVLFSLLHTVQIRPQSSQSNNASLPSFEVASIRPNRSGDPRHFLRTPPGRLLATGMTTKLLIEEAYNVKDFQVAGGPSWIDSDTYDIDAKEEDSLAKELES